MYVKVMVRIFRYTLYVQVMVEPQEPPTFPKPHISDIGQAEQVFYKLCSFFLCVHICFLRLSRHRPHPPSQPGRLCSRTGVGQAWPQPSLPGLDLLVKKRRQERESLMCSKQADLFTGGLVTLLLVLSFTLLCVIAVLASLTL